MPYYFTDGEIKYAMSSFSSYVITFFGRKKSQYIYLILIRKFYFYLTVRVQILFLYKVFSNYFHKSVLCCASIPKHSPNRLYGKNKNYIVRCCRYVDFSACTVKMSLKKKIFIHRIFIFHLLLKYSIK